MRRPRLNSFAGAIWTLALGVLAAAPANALTREDAKSLASSARVHSVGETRSRLGQVIADERFKTLRAFLLERGYTPRVDAAFSGEATAGAGGDIIVIPFQGRTSDGEAVIHIGRYGSTTEWGASILRHVGSGSELGESSLVAEDFVLDQTGRVIPTHSWWSCFWRCLLQGCANAAFCRWVPVAWWQCALTVCGSFAVACSITCIGQ